MSAVLLIAAALALAETVWHHSWTPRPLARRNDQ
jgi:hypothetical protein